MAKRTDYAILRAGFGLTRGLSEEFIQVCEAKRVPIEAIHRLVTPRGRATMEAIAERITADWHAEQPVTAQLPLKLLPEERASADSSKPVDQRPDVTPQQQDGDMLPLNHYRVFVTYTGMPSIDELRKEWGNGNVSDIFDGQPFKLHASCIGMIRLPSEKIFYLHDADCDWESEERIDWGMKQRNAVAPKGYRPATHEETYEFSRANSELVSFLGLGSFVVDDDTRYVACVWRFERRYIFGNLPFDHKHSRDSRILFVAI